MKRLTIKFSPAKDPEKKKREIKVKLEGKAEKAVYKAIKEIMTDIDSIRQRDPAARSRQGPERKIKSEKTSRDNGNAESRACGESAAADGRKALCRDHRPGDRGGGGDQQVPAVPLFS